MKGKKKAKRPWWRKPRYVRRLAIGALALLIVTVGGAYVGIKGDDEPHYNTRFASQFALPTTEGQEVTLNQHLGKHNVLLYFNEGMG
ncbi:MAG TPA: hypothetical protein VLS25_04730 [Dehalococcoidia bacterium]|nr:hypothetical protein [Dehalococcoidia bacterium]